MIWYHCLVDGRPRINRFASPGDVPATTPLSDSISTEMKRRGFRFVGSTIIYAFIQGIGMVNDHVEGCWMRATGGGGDSPAD